jgi:hypothetical protein
METETAARNGRPDGCWRARSMTLWEGDSLEIKNLVLIDCLHTNILTVNVCIVPAG